jgi:molybdate transport system substrate-binding protein
VAVPSAACQDSAFWKIAMAAPLRVLARIPAIALASAWLSGAALAADITLMCPPPMRAVMVDLIAAFERNTGHTVTIVFAPSKTIIARLDGGETVDVAILTATATDASIKSGRLARRVDLARSTIGVAVRHGAPKPDVGSADTFRRTLLAARSFARNDGADSGIYMKGLIERLGIAEQLRPKTTLVPSGYVAELVARGEVELGAQQVSELMSVAGVDVTPLPAELQHVMTFSAGIAAAPASPAAIDALLKFLAAPAAAPLIRAHGLDPA